MAGELKDKGEEHELLKGTGAVKVPIELDQGNILLKIVPWIGGRIMSMIHKPSGLHTSILLPFPTCTFFHPLSLY
jgi:hypothetical protein